MNDTVLCGYAAASALALIGLSRIFTGPWLHHAQIKTGIIWLVVAGAVAFAARTAKA